MRPVPRESDEPGRRHDFFSFVLPLYCTLSSHLSPRMLSDQCSSRVLSMPTAVLARLFSSCADLHPPHATTSVTMSERIKGLVLPGGLVHAHIHLDKCYLLDRTPVGDG